MNKVIVFAVLLASAVGAGFGGAFLFQQSQPQPVSAQVARADGGIRIALINLEEASRQSKKFRELKSNWDEVQRELEVERTKAETAYRNKAMEVQRARLENRGQEEITPLQVEQQTLKEVLDIMKKQQEVYLSSLLAQYQKAVLVEVMVVIENFAKLQKYDVVVQDYTVDAGDSDFFAGGAYAQTLINKPVLFAPGTVNNNNPYVTDITKAIIQLVQ
ncbi:MAG: hypothetical protein IPK87_13160 [Planctomycetes bacterium]|nr:hypothetical protein [Planctomycetota bacterium]